MRVVEITQLTRKEMPLYYRKEFHGCAVLEVMEKRAEKKISFTVEKTPAGATEIRVTFLDELDYPLIPAVQALKEYIRELEKRGGLP
jgi:uncharacterized ParB-like nuclease family protein